MTDRYLLVDGNNALMRAVFAAEGAQMSAGGANTGALVIFINLLSRHLREEHPTHVVVCWDGGRSALRLGLFPDYKANRGEAGVDPEEKGPFFLTKSFLSRAGIHHIERIGWEADDLIARQWQMIRAQDPDAEVVLLSGDKDLFQLLDEKTEQVRPVSLPPTDRWDPARVQEKYGVPPEHLSMAMALIGDISDGVPGVRGIGPKKAATRLQQADFDLSQVVSDLPEEQREIARLSYELVNLRTLDYPSHGLLLWLPPVFRPVGQQSASWSNLVDFLTYYRLASVRDRLVEGTLWQQPPEVP